MYKQRLLIGIVLIVLMLPIVGMAAEANASVNDTETLPTTTSETATEPTAEPVAEYHTMSQEDAKSLLYESLDVILLDVRRLDEYVESHIPGAINIPNEAISDVRPEALDDLNATILVYCRTGVRSKAASDKLVAMGYTGIYDIGGISEWIYGVVSGEYPFGDTELADGAFVCKYCYDTEEPRVCAFCGEKQVCVYCGNCNSCKACAC